MLQKRLNKSEDGSGQYEITDGHYISPSGNHTKGKDLDEDRRDGEETN